MGSCLEYKRSPCIYNFYTEKKHQLKYLTLSKFTHSFIFHSSIFHSYYFYRITLRKENIISFFSPGCNVMGCYETVICPKFTSLPNSPKYKNGKLDKTHFLYYQPPSLWQRITNLPVNIDFESQFTTRFIIACNQTFAWHHVSLVT